MGCSFPHHGQASLSFSILELAQTQVAWVDVAIQSHSLSFPACPQSLPASISFLMSQHFASGGLMIGASASALPANIQGWFPLGLTSWISLQSKGLSRVFSSTTVRKHQFFSAQSPLWSNSHIYTWLLEQPELWLYGPLSAKWQPTKWSTSDVGMNWSKTSRWGKMLLQMLLQVGLG